MFYLNKDRNLAREEKRERNRKIDGKEMGMSVTER